MKNKYLALTLSAVALVACNNEDVLEVNQGRGISFQVATETSTRAAVTTTSTIDEFNVWGFTDAGQALMNDVKVTGSNAAGWSYGTDAIFWPNEGSVDFYAVSPKDCGGTVKVTSGSQIIENFTVKTEAADQKDLLYALTPDQTKDGHADGSKVQLNFRHALSQIVFQAKNTNKNLSVDIDGVRIAKVVSGGTLTFPTLQTSPNLTTTPGNTETETDDSWGEWALSNKKGFFAAGIQTTTDITPSKNVVNLTKNDGALLLMPQTLEGWDISGENGASGAEDRGAYFLVSCKIYNVQGGDEVLAWPKKDEYREVAIPVTDITWKQGKKYVYTFIFGEGGGYVPPIDPEDPDPEDPDPEDPGDPVLVPISFQVTVDDFQNGGEFDVPMNQEDEAASAGA